MGNTESERFGTDWYNLSVRQWQMVCLRGECCSLLVITSPTGFTQNWHDRTLGERFGTRNIWLLDKKQDKVQTKLTWLEK